MSGFAVPRKRRSIYIDKRVFDAFDKQAEIYGVSTNQLIEQIGFMYGKVTGQIPLNAEPLGEGRGGDRTRSKPDTTD